VIRIPVKQLALISALLLLTACGFHLRGNAQIAEVYNPLTINKAELQPEQFLLIQNALRQANARLTDSDEQANELKVFFHRLKNQQIASSSLTDIRLIRLSMQLDYRLKSTSGNLMDENQITHYRELELDNANVLSHQGLIDKEFQELEKSLVRSMIYQLKRK